MKDILVWYLIVNLAKILSSNIQHVALYLKCWQYFLPEAWIANLILWDKLLLALWSMEISTNVSDLKKINTWRGLQVYFGHMPHFVSPLTIILVFAFGIWIHSAFLALFIPKNDYLWQKNKNNLLIFMNYVFLICTSTYIPLTCSTSILFHEFYHLYFSPNPQPNISRNSPGPGLYIYYIKCMQRECMFDTQSFY